ncbi:MAG TPA: hypothetical protein VEJ63_08695 [Planctomycetota bacterium]|nr:hypothetical protein [Planctomycetota bacterium]
MIAQNKLLLAGAVASVAAFVCAHLFFIQSNWAESARQLDTAKQNKDKWDNYFKAKSDEKLVSKPEAEKAIRDSNSALQRKLDELKQIEFGTPDSLHAFSLAAAGNGDPKNYLQSSITTTKQRAKESLSISVPLELGIGEKAAEEPVALNLFRLAMVDRFLTACKDANVPAITRLRYEAPVTIKLHDAPEEAVEDEDDAPKKKGAEKEEKKANPYEIEPLVKFPMRAVITAPERAFSQLLFEVQKPTDAARGYFALRGFHVYVRDANSGMVEASIALEALLSTKTVNKLQIPVKEPDERRRPASQREIDLNRY